MLKIVSQVEPNSKCMGCMHYSQQKGSGVCGINSEPIRCGDGSTPDEGYYPVQLFWSAETSPLPLVVPDPVVLGQMRDTVLVLEKSVRDDFVQKVVQVRRKLAPRQREFFSNTEVAVLLEDLVKGFQITKECETPGYWALYWTDKVRTLGTPEVYATAAKYAWIAAQDLAKSEVDRASKFFRLAKGYYQKAQELAHSGKTMVYLKRAFDLVKGEQEGPGSRGGHIIGYYPSGAPKYDPNQKASPIPHHEQPAPQQHPELPPSEPGTWGALKEGAIISWGGKNAHVSDLVRDGDEIKATLRTKNADTGQDEEEEVSADASYKIQTVTEGTGDVARHVPATKINGKVLASHPRNLHALQEKAESPSASEDDKAHAQIAALDHALAHTHFTKDDHKAAKEHYKAQSKTGNDAAALMGYAHQRAAYGLAEKEREQLKRDIAHRGGILKQRDQERREAEPGIPNVVDSDKTPFTGQEKASKLSTLPEGHHHDTKEGPVRFPATAGVSGGFVFEHRDRNNPSDNRIVMKFDTPRVPTHVFDALRSAGFVFSRTNGQFQRKMADESGAMYRVRQVLSQLGIKDITEHVQDGRWSIATQEKRDFDHKEREAKKVLTEEERQKKIDEMPDYVHKTPEEVGTKEGKAEHQLDSGKILKEHVGLRTSRAEYGAAMRSAKKPSEASHADAKAKLIASAEKFVKEHRGHFSTADHMHAAAYHEAERQKAQVRLKGLKRTAEDFVDHDYHGHMATAHMNQGGLSTDEGRAAILGRAKEMLDEKTVHRHDLEKFVYGKVAGQYKGRGASGVHYVGDGMRMHELHTIPDDALLQMAKRYGWTEGNKVLEGTGPGDPFGFHSRSEIYGAPNYFQDLREAKKQGIRQNYSKPKVNLSLNAPSQETPVQAPTPVDSKAPPGAINIMDLADVNKKSEVQPVTPAQDPAAEGMIGKEGITARMKIPTNNDALMTAIRNYQEAPLTGSKQKRAREDLNYQAQLHARSHKDFTEQDHRDAANYHRTQMTGPVGGLKATMAAALISAHDGEARMKVLQEPIPGIPMPSDAKPSEAPSVDQKNSPYESYATQNKYTTSGKKITEPDSVYHDLADKLESRERDDARAFRSRSLEADNLRDKLKDRADYLADDADLTPEDHKEMYHHYNDLAEEAMRRNDDKHERKFRLLADAHWSEHGRKDEERTARNVETQRGREKAQKDIEEIEGDTEDEKVWHGHHHQQKIQEHKQNMEESPDDAYEQSYNQAMVDFHTQKVKEKYAPDPKLGGISPKAHKLLQAIKTAHENGEPLSHDTRDGQYFDENTDKDTFDHMAAAELKAAGLVDYDRTKVAPYEYTVGKGRNKRKVQVPGGETHTLRPGGRYNHWEAERHGQQGLSLGGTAGWRGPVPVIPVPSSVSSAAPSDIDEQIQMYQDIVETNKFHGRPTKAEHLKKLGDLKALKAGQAPASAEEHYGQEVFGHPSATNVGGGKFSNLIPLKVKDTDTVDRKIDSAQKHLDEVRKRLYGAEAASKGKDKATQKQAQAYLNSHQATEDRTVVEMLEKETMPELQRLRKLVQPPVTSVAGKPETPPQALKDIRSNLDTSHVEAHKNTANWAKQAHGLSDAQHRALRLLANSPEGEYHQFDAGTGSSPGAVRHGINPSTSQSLIDAGYLEASGKTTADSKFKLTQKGKQMGDVLNKRYARVRDEFSAKESTDEVVPGKEKRAADFKEHFKNARIHGGELDLGKDSKEILADMTAKHPDVHPQYLQMEMDKHLQAKREELQPEATARYNKPVDGGMARFLQEKTGSPTGKFEGKISAEDQRKYFGKVLFDRSETHIDGSTGDVVMHGSVNIGGSRQKFPFKWGALKEKHGLTDAPVRTYVGSGLPVEKLDLTPNDRSRYPTVDGVVVNLDSSGHSIARKLKAKGISRADAIEHMEGKKYHVRGLGSAQDMLTPEAIRAYVKHVYETTDKETIPTPEAPVASAKGESLAKLQQTIPDTGIKMKPNADLYEYVQGPEFAKMDTAHQQKIREEAMRHVIQHEGGKETDHRKAAEHYAQLSQRALKNGDTPLGRYAQVMSAAHTSAHQMKATRSGDYSFTGQPDLKYADSPHDVDPSTLTPEQAKEALEIENMQLEAAKEGKSLTGAFAHPYEPDFQRRTGQRVAHHQANIEALHQIIARDASADEMIQEAPAAAKEDPNKAVAKQVAQTGVHPGSAVAQFRETAGDTDLNSTEIRDLVATEGVEHYKEAHAKATEAAHTAADEYEKTMFQRGASVSPDRSHLGTRLHEAHNEVEKITTEMSKLDDVIYSHNHTPEERKAARESHAELEKHQATIQQYIVRAKRQNLAKMAVLAAENPDVREAHSEAIAAHKKAYGVYNGMAREGVEITDPKKRIRANEAARSFHSTEKPAFDAAMSKYAGLLKDKLSPEELKALSVRHSGIPQGGVSSTFHAHLAEATKGTQTALNDDSNHPEVQKHKDRILAATSPAEVDAAYSASKRGQFSPRVQDELRQLSEKHSEKLSQAKKQAGTAVVPTVPAPVKQSAISTQQVQAVAKPAPAPEPEKPKETYIRGFADSLEERERQAADPAQTDAVLNTLITNRYNPLLGGVYEERDGTKEKEHVDKIRALVASNPNLSKETFKRLADVHGSPEIYDALANNPAMDMHQWEDPELTHLTLPQVLQLARRGSNAAKQIVGTRLQNQVGKDNNRVDHFDFGAVREAIKHASTEEDALHMHNILLDTAGRALGHAQEAAHALARNPNVSEATLHKMRDKAEALGQRGQGGQTKSKKNFFLGSELTKFLGGRNFDYGTNSYVSPTEEEKIQAFKNTGTDRMYADFSEKDHKEAAAQHKKNAQEAINAINHAKRKGGVDPAIPDQQRAHEAMAEWHGLRAKSIEQLAEQAHGMTEGTPKQVIEEAIKEKLRRKKFADLTPAEHQAAMRLSDTSKEEYGKHMDALNAKLDAAAEERRAKELAPMSIEDHKIALNSLAPGKERDAHAKFLAEKVQAQKQADQQRSNADKFKEAQRAHLSPSYWKDDGMYNRATDAIQALEDNKVHETITDAEKLAIAPAHAWDQGLSPAQQKKYDQWTEAKTQKLKNLVQKQKEFVQHNGPDSWGKLAESFERPTPQVQKPVPAEKSPSIRERAKPSVIPAVPVDTPAPKVPEIPKIQTEKPVEFTHNGAIPIFGKVKAQAPKKTVEHKGTGATFKEGAHEGISDSNEKLPSGFFPHKAARAVVGALHKNPDMTIKNLVQILKPGYKATPTMPYSDRRMEGRIHAMFADLHKMGHLDSYRAPEYPKLSSMQFKNLDKIPEGKHDFEGTGFPHSAVKKIAGYMSKHPNESLETMADRMLGSSGFWDSSRDGDHYTTHKGVAELLTILDALQKKGYVKASKGGAK